MKKILIKATALILTICMVAGIPVVSFGIEGEPQAEDSTKSESTEIVQESETEAEEAAMEAAEEAAGEELNTADYSNLAISVSNTTLKCGTPVRFTVNATGGSGEYKYYLSYISRKNEDGWFVVIDPSRSFTSYQTTNYFDFTFSASGEYRLRFYVMDMKNLSSGSISKTVNVTINDPSYPSVEDVADEVAADCIASGCKTDFDKAVWLHDWLLDNCKYDNSLWYCSQEGAITRGTGTCEAYHRAYTVLLKRVGVETGRIVGNGHVWTAVKMDGKWYQIDVTWDDSMSNLEYMRHIYFGLTDDMMSKVHSEHQPNAGYESNSIDDNYFIKTGEASKWVENYRLEIQNKIDQGETDFEIKTPTEQNYIDYVRYSVMAGELSREDWNSGGIQRKVSVTYSNSAFNCNIKHNYKTITTPGGYLRHGVTYKKCALCGDETAHKCAYNGYSTLYAKSFKVSKGKKCFTAKWKKANKKTQKQFTGYQIQYSLNADMSGARYAAAGKSAKSKKIKGLAKKRVYYVRVRTYVNTNGSTFYSGWSARKSVKTR